MVHPSFTDTIMSSSVLFLQMEMTVKMTLNAQRSVHFGHLEPLRVWRELVAILT